MTDETHDFENTVVAILESEPETGDATQGLARAGYDFEVLAGEQGKKHLDPTGESGPVTTVKRLLNAFGDQYRVLDRLYDELDRGKLVVSVESEPDQADEAIRILREHGGEYIWRFGTWTFTRIGE